MARVDFDFDSLGNVLVVEDSPLMRKLIVKILDAFGIKSIYTASSGQEALDLSDQVFFDVIFMNIVMPGMDGFEATRILRQMDRGKHPYIIAVTGSSCSSLEETCCNNHINALLRKPFNGVDVMECFYSYFEAQCFLQGANYA